MTKSVELLGTRRLALGMVNGGLFRHFTQTG